MTSDREYTLPEKVPGETYGNWGRRAVDAIPQDVLIRKMFAVIRQKTGYTKRDAATVVEKVLGYRAELSAAIAAKYNLE